MFKRDYNFHEIEEKWQDYWGKNKTFKTENTSNKPKYYVLDMFPYPSGNGLHVGHPKGYVGSDIIARYKRMKGFNVLHPMGWDSFGLPTERQSVKENTHPNLITKRNVDTFRNQLKIIGLGYDWDRELATSHESYYKWTQWIFLKLFEKGLAYRAEIPVNWCPALGTVLSNEEVKDGKYVETGDDVEKRLMSQWMLKITAYADRLVEDLELVDWPESVKEMQKNWIGKSEGASVKFNIENSDKAISVFTTRPDTLFGCSYVVLAPEHQLVKELITETQKEVVNEYIEKTGKLSERDRISGTEKTGVFTGSYAICPVNNKKVQIWISDYVLATYGTGAVFACPAHDERDYEFAKKFQLDIIEVVKGGNITEAAYTEDGEHVNSEFLDGLKINEAKTKVISWLEANNAGKSEINYKLRDWLFSRQRYWGEPIPILINKKDGSIKAVPESELPILLPHLDDLTPPPDGRPPLSKATEWVNYNDEYERETNTMPQWAGSCWYYLRFIDPTNTEFAWDKELEKAMMPVDLYIGGTEHATLHLLYARFWHKFLYDLGYVSTKEPFKKLFNQGLIQAQSYQDEAGKYYYPKEVYEKDDKWFSRDGDKPLRVKVEKMSKSRHNVTTPDEVIENYGADSLRLYELFIGPLEDGAVWQTDNISGVKRLLDRVWNLFTEEKMEKENKVLDKKLEIVLNQTIKKITEDIEALHFNTSISQLMIFVNELYKHNTIPVSVLETLVKLLSPFAPHMAEELWERLGHEPSIALVSWPDYDPSKVVESEIEIPVQINGKLRATVSVPRDSDEATVKEAALKAEAITKAIEGKTIAKVIYVNNKIFNLIVKG